MNLSRVISLLIVVVYAFFALRLNDPFLMALPITGMAFVWFPSLAKVLDSLGALNRHSASMDPNTPSCVFALIGWGMLLMPALIAMIGHFANM
ncbi:MAG: hypothetical protein ACOYXC_00910 [Candidatus Rifleibacteriota bacterium]